MNRWWKVIAKFKSSIQCSKTLAKMILYGKHISLISNIHSQRHAVAPMADRHLNINSEILKHNQDNALNLCYALFKQK
jgi:hypothetical protein